MRVRPLVEGDWPQVHAIVVEMAEEGETYALDVPADESATRAFWTGEHLVVAVDGDRVLGAAKAGPNRPAQGRHVGTASFVVAAEARGRGVGRMLGEHVVAWHREAGFAAIQFNAVVATNVAAVALWTSLGFVVVGRVPAAFRRPTGGSADLLVMHLDLAPTSARPLARRPGETEEHARVLEVAHRRFTAQGWSGTTLTEIATEAGVGTSRLTRLLGTKAELFATLVWRRILGPHADLDAVFDELHLEEEPDVDVRLDLVVQALLRLVPQVEDLLPVMAEAGARDSNVRAMQQGAELQRVATSRMLVRVLSRTGTPRPDAVVEVQMLCTAESYRSMNAFGWSRERYAAWLRQALDHAVNGPAATP